MNAAAGAIPSVNGGMPELIPDYMDEIGKMKDKAMGQVQEKYEEMKEKIMDS